MNFFKTIANSIYSPEFYKSLVKGEYKSSFGYFFLFILICAVLKTAFIMPQIFVFQDVVATMGAEAVEKFPADLKVMIKNGKVSTNVEEPYFVPVPESKDANSALAGIKNLIVIDTKTPYSAEQLDKYKTLAWLTSDSVFYSRERSGKIETFALTGVKDFTLDKSFLDSKFKTFSPLFKMIGPLLVVLAMIGIYVAYISQLLYLFFLALLVWLVATVMKIKLDYWVAYRVGVHAITASLLVGLIFTLIQIWVPIRPFFFMSTFIALIVAGVNLGQSRKIGGVA